MAILPQTPEAPSGLTVYELVSYGRFPHQSGMGRLSDKDRDMIKWALEETGMAEFYDRPIEALSGASGSVCGSPWRSLKKRSCCFLMNRPLI